MYLLNSLVHAVFEKYFSSEISLLLRKSYWICGCLNPGFIFWKAPEIKTKSSNIAWKYPKFLSRELYKPYFTSTHLHDILNWLFYIYIYVPVFLSPLLYFKIQVFTAVVCCLYVISMNICIGTCYLLNCSNKC